MREEEEQQTTSSSSSSSWQPQQQTSSSDVQQRQSERERAASHSEWRGLVQRNWIYNEPVYTPASADLQPTFSLSSWMMRSLSVILTDDIRGPDLWSVWIHRYGNSFTPSQIRSYLCLLIYCSVVQAQTYRQWGRYILIYSIYIYI